MKLTALKSACYYCYAAFLFLLLNSCKKEGSGTAQLPPGDVKPAYINFYCAADVMVQGMNDHQPNYIFIDNLKQEDTSDFYGYRAPSFKFSPTGDGDLYSFPVENNNLNLVYYMSVRTGSHHLYFCGSTLKLYNDTLVNLPVNSYNTYYLADKPGGAAGSAPAFTILEVPEENKGVTGKLRVRFICLSPDAGRLGVFKFFANGEKVTDGLPQQLDYGTVSPYMELDTAGTINKNVILKITDSLSKEISMVSIPANPGHNYVVVLQGFNQQQQRRIPLAATATQPAGYRDVIISPNVRAVVRASF